MNRRIGIHSLCGKRVADILALVVLITGVDIAMSAVIAADTDHMTCEAETTGTAI